MALCINQSGTWRTITTQCVNQSGTWRKVVTGCINQSGTWRCFGFTPPPPARGCAYEGGFLICTSSSIAWVVAPNTSEVTRCWYLRNDANTRAQQVSGCTGWFVPTIAQLQNPGYICRTFWDSISVPTSYWSSTESDAGYAYVLASNFGEACVGFNGNKGNTQCVRAFRCVTY
jgi:hypothetical protein